MDADDLYGLALDRFVAERTTLAKGLRKEGRREEAGEVAALRKPSVAAWAVNQLVRTQRAAVLDLLAAGDALRDAQSELLAGRGDGRALRAAADRERAAVDGLVQAARGLLSSEGVELSATVIDRVSETLHAAALDEDAREQVRHGRLERELRHAGLGLGLGSSETLGAPPTAARAPQRLREAPSSTGAGATRERAKRKGAPAPAAATSDARLAKRKGAPAPAAATSDARLAKPAAAGKRAERERAEAERAEAERERRERAAARRDARAAHATARRHADAATRALRSAEERRDDAAQALREADAAVAAAATEAEAAGATLERAEADLAEAEGRR